MKLRVIKTIETDYNGNVFTAFIPLYLDEGKGWMKCTLTSTPVVYYKIEDAIQAAKDFAKKALDNLAWEGEVVKEKEEDNHE